MARYIIDFYSKSLLRRYEIRVVIPSLNLQGTLKNKNENYYSENNEKYPLCIFLSGFGENQRSWQYNTQVDRLLEENKVAGVFINGENKWYLNQGPIDAWYDLVEKDVLDFLYGNFKCLSKEKPLMIAGNSMGGYGALYHYLKNIDKYSACVALSPATKPDFLDESKYGTLRELFLENKGKKLNCYISVGTKDFIIDASKEFDKFLKDNEIGVSYRFIEDRDHSWFLWKDEIFSVFEYFKELGLIGA